MSSTNFDVIVIGGGVIGASCAYALSKAGQRVALLEPRAVGLGASGRSAAMLECQLDAHRGEPFLSLSRASARLFPALYQAIKSQTGIDFHYETRGILHVAFSEEENAALKEEVVLQRKLDFKIHWLEKDDLNKEFPQINPYNFGAVLYEEDGQVTGEIFLKALLEAAKGAGAHIEENTAAVELTLSGGKVTGAKTKSGHFHAPWIVAAAGAWTDKLLSPLDFRTGITPVRGQLLLYDDPQPSVALPVYTKRNGYVVPKQNGKLLVGTTVENAGFDESTTPEGRSAIQNLGEFLLPALKGRTPVSATAGLRPGAPEDGLPIIGPVPGYDNVIIASGHYRNGVLLAPITGDIVTSLILKKSVPIDAQSFFPQRLLQL